MTRTLGLAVCSFVFALAAWADDSAPLLIRDPTINGDKIAFSYAGEIWTVSRDGGDAQRLTSGVGSKGGPSFSPDGKWIAYTAEYYGNPDVFVIPSTGGEPKRLTSHPGVDYVEGWTPDGKSILFGSTRTSATDPPKLFTVPVEGGLPTELPLPMASSGAFSPDGTKIAYTPRFQWQAAWKRYRGGQTMEIWIARLSDSQVEKIPRNNSNDFQPMWVGKNVYFLSDRDGPVSLYTYDTETKKVSEVVRNQGLDFKSASAGPGALVYEQFGSLHVLDLRSGKTKTVNVRVPGEFAEVLPHFEKLDSKRILNAALSPTGARAVFEIHGEIVTVPAEKGDIRNLTNTPSAADRDPAWSPDGKRVAWFSDESGEYELHIRNQNGLGDVTRISLGNPPSFFYSPVWSPDSKKIAYTDKRLNVWYVDVEKGTPVKVDTDYYEAPFHTLNPVWAPDSKWLAYTKQLKSHLHAVFVYELEKAKASQITDGFSDALYADWDKNGKYLYLTASTDIGLGLSWLDMSSINRPVTRSAYLVVLSKEETSPLVAESDEEKGEESKPQPKPDEAKDKPKEPPAVRIDLEGIGQRILALPVPAKNYIGLSSGQRGRGLSARSACDFQRGR
jgi:tricorn protease